MRKISIFVRPSYIGNRYPSETKEPVLMRISSRIRGEDLAEHLGAKLNPKQGFEDDICIFVKPKYLELVEDGDYLDYLDGVNMWVQLKNRPKIKVIAASQASFKFLKNNIQNEIFLIPQHHLNWEKQLRSKRKVNVAGYIGAPSPAAFKMYGEIRKRLKKIGFEFNTCFNFRTRDDAVNFYKSIDLLVIGDWVKDDNHTKIPTKIINAASFGVPTVAYPLKGYEEIEGYYVHGLNNDLLLKEAEKFRDENYYRLWSEKVLSMSQPYHIGEIVKLYQKLK